MPHFANTFNVYGKMTARWLFAEAGTATCRRPVADQSPNRLRPVAEDIMKSVDFVIFQGSGKEVHDIGYDQAIPQSQTADKPMAP